MVRKITVQNNDVKIGVWQKNMGNLLYEKTLGIIGLGKIGKTLVKLVKGFNFKIMAFDMFHDDKFAQEYGVTYCDIESLITQSDIISIHVVLGERYKDLITKKKINLRSSFHKFSINEEEFIGIHRYLSIFSF